MKKAFSLIELMIVIVIIGVIYTLVITKLQVYQKQEEKLSLKTLKPFLAKIAKEYGGEARLVCLDECKSCGVYVDGEKAASMDGFIDKDIEVYSYDYLQGMIQKDPAVFFNKEDVQEDVCFSFKVDKNKVSDQVIIVYKDKAYDYSNYFSDVDVYDSLQDVQDAKEKLIEEVK